MRQRYLLLGSGLFAMVAVLAGCATGSAERAAAPRAAISQTLGDQAFHYRQEAVHLRDMAQRLEFEAQWYAKQGGQDSEQAKRSREMAKDFWSAAEEADQRARDYWRQVPHNQVY